MRPFILTLVLTFGCNSGTDDTDDVDTGDDSGTTADTDTSDDSDTSDDTEADSEEDTEAAVACEFTDLSSRIASTAVLQEFASFSTEAQVDVCFGGELEGRLVREAYNANGLLCRIVLPFSATTSVADEDLCDTCDDGFEDITWETGTATGPSCNDLRMYPEPPLFCDGQTAVQVSAVATGTNPDTLYRHSVADGYNWRPWISGTNVVRGEDPASGVSTMSTSQGTYNPQAQQFPPCESQTGASR